MSKNAFQPKQKPISLIEWQDHFSEFFTTTEAQKHLQKLFHVYLQSTEANCPIERNKMLFFKTELRDLLTILNQTK